MKIENAIEQETAARCGILAKLGALTDGSQRMVDPQAPGVEMGRAAKTEQNRIVAFSGSLPTGHDAREET